MLGYMSALHSKAVKSRNTVRKSFRGSNASLVQQLQTSFTQEGAAVFKSFDITKRKVLIELRRSISECEAAAKVRLDRLVGGNFEFAGTSGAVPVAGGTGGASDRASGAGPSK